MGIKLLRSWGITRREGGSYCRLEIILLISTSCKPNSFSKQASSRTLNFLLKASNSLPEDAYLVVREDKCVK